MDGITDSREAIRDKEKRFFKSSRFGSSRRIAQLWADSLTINPVSEDLLVSLKRDSHGEVNSFLGDGIPPDRQIGRVKVNDHVPFPEIRELNASRSTSTILDISRMVWGLSWCPYIRSRISLISLVVMPFW